MKIKIRLQLSMLMFLQYFVWGTWYVTISTYLTNTLNFRPVEVGLVFGTFSIAAMISPFFVGLVADKFFASEKVLGFLHILGAILLFATTYIKSFGLFYAGLLSYTLCYVPTIAISNSLSFHQMDNPGKEFPSIRVLGTIGWIVAMNIIGLLKVEASVGQLYLGSASSLILGLYCFTLPHVPPKKETKASFREILGLDALQLLKDKPFLLMFIASILTCIPLSFYYSWTNPFLNELGMQYAANKMSLGQMSEAVFMLIMPFFFIRLGVKKMVIIGMISWILRYVLFAHGDIGPMVWMLYLGIILHGLCYDFFFVTGQIYVDTKAPSHLKSSAQGMITFATYGLGMFIGTWFSGVIVGIYTSTVAGQEVHDWTSIWYVPTVVAILVLIFFVLLFKEKRGKKRNPVPVNGG
ncbi:MAG: nucleoside permease [Bacteroidales bacterium]|nr:nucleoside permease [Bacteroidales bacterium]